jgi:ribulose-5-phosphate 4-epimerase/fuculose-1-phosphate aldolase
VHPDHLIALTLLPSLRGEGVLEATLANLMPETALALERGLRRLPYADPGGGSLAAFSADAFAEADAVIWDQHGALVRAPGLGAALDRMEMLEKAARVWLLAARAGERPAGFRDAAQRAGRA